MDEHPGDLEQLVGTPETSEPPGEDAGSPEPREVRARRPLWRRLLGLLLEVIIIASIAATIPWVLSVVLDSPHPLATITSSSMWPTLRRGDLVLIKAPSSDAIVPGTIVVFDDAESGTMVIHRIIAVNNARITTQGDANTQPDDPISTQDVVGVVPTLLGRPARIPYIGYVTMWTQGGS